MSDLRSQQPGVQNSGQVAWQNPKAQICDMNFDSSPPDTIKGLKFLIIDLIFCFGQGGFVLFCAMGTIDRFGSHLYYSYVQG